MTRRLALAMALSLAPAAVLAEVTQADLVVERCRAVAVRGGVLYVGSSHSLSLKDVAVPSNPRSLSRIALPADVVGITLVGSKAYLALRGAGVAVVDVSDSKRPVLLGRDDTQGLVERVEVAGEIAFLANGSQGIEVANLAKPDQPVRLAAVSTRDSVRAVSLAETLLASAEGRGGARLFDVSNPAAPKLLSTLDRAESTQDVGLCGRDVLVVAAGRQGIQVYDVRNASRPERVATIEVPTAARHVACGPERAAVSLGDAGVIILDLSEPRVPRVAGTAKLPRGHPAGASCFSGDLLFVAADEGGLGLVDLVNPAQPQVLLPTRRKMTVHFPD